MLYVVNLQQDAPCAVVCDSASDSRDDRDAITATKAVPLIDNSAFADHHCAQGEEALVDPLSDCSDPWSLEIVCYWGNELHSGCTNLWQSVERINVTSPLVELGGDLVDFSAALGKRIVSPLAELSGDLALEVHSCATRTRSSIGKQSGLVRMSSKSIVLGDLSSCKLSILDEEAEMMMMAEMIEDQLRWAPFIIVGLLSPTPSGMVVLAGTVVPAFSLKAVCVFTGACMFWKCWMLHSRAPSEGTKTRTDLAIAVAGICGAVNLGLAFGGVPALLKLGGFTAVHLSAYVAHPDLCVHYLADLVLNPMILLDVAYCSKVTGAPAKIIPTLVVSALGASFMVGTSVSTCPIVVGVCVGANLCCILFQNWDMQSHYSTKARARKCADAYVFGQALYLVPTVLGIATHSKAMIAVVPLIDLFAKMGVVQLSHNEDGGVQRID